MNSKYGEISPQVIIEYKKNLHKCVHRLLYYQEDGYLLLDDYFKSLLTDICGCSSLFYDDLVFILIMAKLESARNERLKSNFCFDKYRKAILDTHTLIDSLPIKEEC